MAIPEQCPMQSICQKMADGSWQGKNVPGEQQMAFLNSVKKSCHDKQEEALACYTFNGKNCQFDSRNMAIQAKEGKMFLVYAAEALGDIRPGYSQERVDNLVASYRKGQPPQSR